MKYVIQTLLFVLLLAGCSKEAAKFNPTLGEDVGLGPNLQDTDLNFGAGSFSDASKHAYFKSTGYQSSSKVLRLSSQLNNLSKDSGNGENIAKLAQKIADSFYGGRNTVKTQTFSESHLIDTVLNEVRQQFATNSEDLVGQPARLVATADAEMAKYQFTDWNDFMSKLEPMLLDVMDAVEADPELTDRVKESFLETFQTYVDVDIPDIKAAINAGLFETNSLILADLVLNTMAEYDYDLDPEDETRLNNTRDAAYHIDIVTEDDPQSAVTAYVKVWRITDEEDRYKFEEANRSMYAIVNGASELELDCLAQRESCINLGVDVMFFDDFIKQPLIISGFEDEGPLVVKERLHTQVSEGIRERLWESALETQQSISEGIAEEFGKTETLLGDAAADIRGQLMPHVSQFDADEFGGAGYHYHEANVVDFNLEGSDSLTCEGVVRIESAYTSPAALGASLKYHVSKWNTGDVANTSEYRLEVLGAINKMFSIGGYTQADGSTYQGLARATADIDAASYNLTDTDSMTMAYTIANQEAISGNTVGQRSIDIGEQAQLLEGILEMVDYLEDWEKGDFEPAFSKYTANQFFGAEIADIAGDAGEERFITKPDMYAMAIGQMGAFLKGMSLRGSLLVLLTDDGYVYVEDETTSDNTESIGVSLLGYTEGQRDKNFDVGDVADYLHAIAKAYILIGRIEQTSSDKLLDVSEGPSGVSTLLDARANDLNSLLIGLGGFLIGNAIDSNGLVAKEVTLDGLKKVSVGTDLATHAKVIRALVTLSEAMDSEVFAWAAQDIYYGMNKNAWQTDKRFYQMEGDLDIYQIAETLDALKALRPKLPESSQPQVDKILNTWVPAFATF